LRGYVDFFAWNYTEMLSLGRDLVEHRLPIKPRFRPYKQPAWNFNPTVLGKVKEEVDRLLQVKFIWPCRYADWMLNIVPIEKKGTGKIRVCVDFWNLNRVTPKDEYPMPIADILINNASSNKMINFLDGNMGYNHIFMVEEDVSMTAFCCPGFVGLFKWVVMTFSLKNTRATYQRAMNLIFHNLLGVMMEIYIDDTVIKYGLRMNPLKCAFDVTAGRFLGFVVHEQGIQIDPKKVESISKIGEPTCKRDVQKLLGKINYLRRFISNLSGKVESFLPLVQLKHSEDFVWGWNKRRC
jgi:hypothetical protein